MTLDDLRKFANSTDGWVRQIPITREAARAIVAEHEREVAKNLEPAFEIPERDDGKFAGRMFGVYAKAEADFQNAKLRRPLEDRS